jgi:hypothetical protein
MADNHSKSAAKQFSTAAVTEVSPGSPVRYTGPGARGPAATMPAVEL